MRIYISLCFISMWAYCRNCLRSVRMVILVLIGKNFWPNYRHFSTRYCQQWIKQDRQCTYNRNFEAPSHNHFCRGKTISIIYYEFVCVCVSVALVTQHAKYIRRIILSSVVCLAVRYISTLCHKRQDFRGKHSLTIKCILIFSTTFVWKISHSKNNSTRCHKCTYVFV
jgi:hypothetical protein